jgi:hypothetical protein
VATSLTDVATKLIQPEIQALCRDCPEIVRALALKARKAFREADLQLRSHLSRAGRPERALGGWPKVVNELLTVLQSNLSGLADSRPNPLPDSQQALERALVLRPAMVGFRNQVSHAWSPGTACPGYVTQSHLPWRNPLGQCGVSSVWLADVLVREYSIRSTFCHGSLILGQDNVENLEDHCWLEINEQSGDNLILDLTCSQAQGLNRTIVFDSKLNLHRQDFHYTPRERMDVLDLPNNPVWPRYETLLLNMIPSMLARFGGWLGLANFLTKVLANRMFLGFEAAVSQPFVIDQYQPTSLEKATSTGDTRERQSLRQTAG